MIDALFTLLNFAVFVGLFIFVWRIYLHEAIIGHLLRKKAESLELGHKKTLLLEEERHLLEQQAYQGILYQSLRDKVDIWRAAVHRRQDIHSAQREQQKSRALERVMHQMRHMELCRDTQMVVPEAYEAARRELLHYFDSDAHASEYMQRILGRLKAGE